jgi:L-threonylcarbamoyladenylate synthase
MLDAMPDQRLEEAVEHLRRAEVIAFPTETFYGLAADALNEAAVDRLARLKGRPPAKAIACIIGDLSQIPMLCADWPPLAQRVAERFWPGPVTLVVPARPELPLSLRPEGSVGFRLSSHPLARALANGLGRPITATSANFSSQGEVTRAADVDAGLRAQLACVLDGGETPGGRGSTVVAVDGERLRCLRDGALPFGDVLRALAVA